MSKRYKIPPINLTDYKAKKAEEGAVPIVVGDRTFYVRPSELMSDAEYEAYNAVKGEDIVAQARLMMVDYDDFVAAGGSAILLLSIVKDHMEAQAAAQGVEPGESEASSTSSKNTKKPSRPTSSVSTA